MSLSKPDNHQADDLTMTLLTRYLLELREYGPKRLLGAGAWTVSAGWLALKDVGWLSAIGLVCVATLALSLVATKHARNL